MNPFKLIMEKDNLTYKELGKIFGITKQSAHQLVNDHVKPNAKTLLTLLILYKDYFTPLNIYMYYFGQL